MRLVVTFYTQQKAGHTHGVQGLTEWAALVFQQTIIVFAVASPSVSMSDKKKK